MATRSRRATRGRPWCGVDEALIDAVDAIADMAQRVQMNGPETVYASEKLAFALYRAAEALALCGVELEEAIGELHLGYRHGHRTRENER